ncbi:hypothetical protein [Edaphovirga cremea]|uniref:hypothetical protein n=1 Tax=Edaphovirga cremea TaxID=2267246 RepID=UPI000DEF9A56|nr:hypothetical protein [Edaphovirga cremea]
MKKKFITLMVSLILVGCSSTPPPESHNINNQLTAGAVTQYIHKGKTTQADIVAVFGQPQIVTQGANKDAIWTYQATAQVATKHASGAFANIFIAGVDSNNATTSDTQRIFTLILRFDAKGVVSDYQMRQSTF